MVVVVEEEEEETAHQHVLYEAIKQLLSNESITIEPYCKPHELHDAYRTVARFWEEQKKRTEQKAEAATMHAATKTILIL